MYNTTGVEQLLDLLDLKEQLISKLQEENRILKEEVANNTIKAEVKLNNATKEREQEIADLNEVLARIQEKHTRHVDENTILIEQLNKDIKLKERMMEEDYVKKDKYAELVENNKQKKEKTKHMKTLLLNAQEEAEQNKIQLAIKSKEYNNSFEELKQATLGQLSNFENAYHQMSVLNQEVSRLQKQLEQKEREATRAQNDAQAIEKSMSQMKVKYEQELYITRQMLKVQPQQQQQTRKGK